MEGAFRYLRRASFLEDERFMQGLAASPGGAQAALDDALQRCLQRGSLLEASLDLEGGRETFYFLNSPKGRAAVQAIARGEWRFSEDSNLQIALGDRQPNIFELYEQNIGVLTPMIADALREAEETFPPLWIEEAFKIAVENNARNWRYVYAILNRWQVEGRDDREDRRDTEKARRRYAEE